MAGAVRDGFVQEIMQMYAMAKAHGQKPASLYYRISEKHDYDLTHDELVLVANLLGYQPGWAWHKHQEQPARRDTWLEAKTQQKAEKRGGWFDDWNDYVDVEARKRRQRAKNEQFRQGSYTQYGQGAQSFQSFQHNNPLIDAINLLQLKPGFTAMELKAAYRKYVMKHHPDRGGDAAAFQKGVEANDLLSKHTTAEPEEAPF